MKIIKRKIIQSGNKLMVSLPKEWLDLHNIKKGDEVLEVMIKEGICVLPPCRETVDMPAVVSSEPYIILGGRRIW